RNLFLRCEVTIGFPFVKQFERRRAMLVGIVRLKDDLFVVVEFKPGKAVEDRPCRFVCRTRKVGVFYSKQEFPAGVAGVKVVKKSRPGRTDMKVSRGRRCKSDAY